MYPHDAFYIATCCTHVCSNQTIQNFLLHHSKKTNLSMQPAQYSGTAPAPLPNRYNSPQDMPMPAVPQVRCVHMLRPCNMHTQHSIHSYQHARIRLEGYLPCSLICPATARPSSFCACFQTERGWHPPAPPAWTGARRSLFSAIFSCIVIFVRARTAYFLLNLYLELKLTKANQSDPPAPRPPFRRCIL